MKAIVITQYGDPCQVLKLQDVEKPTPSDNQVLIRVKAASVNVSDALPVRGALVVRMFGTGWLRPKSQHLGSDVAGIVEAVGKDVTEFKPGDEVFGSAPGSYAEYACAREAQLALKPAHVPFQEAAGVAVAGISALQGLRAGAIQAGQKVLIYGASGAVGTYAVQIAKALGTHVTAVCSSHNLEQTKALGADQVIDYARADVTQGAEKFDLILAVNGAHSMAEYRRILNPSGVCVVVGGKMSQIAQGLLAGPVSKKKGPQKLGSMGMAQLNKNDLFFLKELMESGKMKTAIDKVFPLENTCDAVLYIGEGHARGKVIIKVGEN
jgi:NADPH:quinone reductase-like Zn-dependent oxidoreductase